MAQLTPPSGPNSPSSQRPTLNQVYEKLTTGSASPTQSGFVGPTSGPSSTTMHSLNDLMALMPEVDDTNCAQPSDVIDGQTYWGLCSGEWGYLTGTAADVETEWPVQLPASGQTDCYDVAGDPISCAGTGQDGEYQYGVATSPRFTDNNDGTVTDNLTGLIWLKNANCFDSRTWEQALSDANTLASGTCGLSDGSISGDWRLSNRKEVLSLIDYQQAFASLPIGHPFTSVTNNTYWTSTTRLYDESTAWTVHLAGSSSHGAKTDTHYLWPVR
ncbi:MAG: DUF1566 domain-containing protein [Candidatus Saccharibacteria bacterium]|nr:DUF1566 domain-containing protein [Candidatus Saccharibacteria bacterium]